MTTTTLAEKKSIVAVQSAAVRFGLGIALSALSGLMLLLAFAPYGLWPLAWFGFKIFLQNFAYRIDMGLGTFILGGLIVLTIAALTVSYQAVKAATANPIESLRYE